MRVCFSDKVCYHGGIQYKRGKWDGYFSSRFAANAFCLHTAGKSGKRDAMVPAGKADGSGFGVVSGNKVHTCDFDVERNLTPGEDFYAADLDTGRGLVRIGAMICYDREFPESARILMLKGAEIILVPNACPMEQNRLTQLRARAFENMLGIATANYAYGQPDCNGHSSAFDGMAYRLGETHERDTLVIEAGEAEGIYLATFPIKEIRRYRSREVHANAYRHPRKYGVLVCEKKQAPFLREDSRD